MSRSIQVDVLLGIIEQTQREFAVDALSRMPDDGNAAFYHHGVYRGMESVKINVLNRIKEEDGKGATSGAAGEGARRAY